MRPRRWPVLALVALAVGGCSSAAPVLQAAVPAPPSPTPSPTPSATALDTAVPPVSPAHLRDLKRRGYATTPADPVAEGAATSLARAIRTAKGPGFVGRAPGATVEASFVRVTMRFPRDAATQRRLVVDRPAWLVVVGGDAVDVPIFGPAPAECSVWVGRTGRETPPRGVRARPDPEACAAASRGQTSFRADLATFVDAATGRMIRTSAI